MHTYIYAKLFSLCYPNNAGIFCNAKKGSLVIDCSTIDPLATRALSDEAKQEYGMDLIDAPVSGGVTGTY